MYTLHVILKSNAPLHCNIIQNVTITNLQIKKTFGLCSYYHNIMITLYLILDMN